MSAAGITSASVATSLTAFSVVAALLTVTPGLDTLLVIRSTVTAGRRSGYLTGLGVCTGVLVWGVGSAVGVTALLAASRAAFDALRLLGAAYLFWLGGQALWGSRPRAANRDRTTGPGLERDEGRMRSRAVPRRLTASTGFRRGLLTNLLNPKVGVFYITLLPQFIPAGGPALLLSVVMASIHAAEGALWFTLLVLLIGRLRRWVENPRTSRVIERVSGTVLLGFGVRLAVERI